MGRHRKFLQTAAVVCAAAMLISTGLIFVSRRNRGRAMREQYAVYSGYIENGLTGESHSLGDRRGTLLIAAEATMVGDFKGLQRLRATVGLALNLHSRSTPPRSSLILGLLIANLKTHRLDRRFTISAKYQLLDYSVLVGSNISERFPKSYGFLTFSSVAFNSDMANGLFYTEHLCGLCGGGELVLMRKTGGNWMIAHRHGTWVS
jgi:hypothetical protein